MKLNLTLTVPYSMCDHHSACVQVVVRLESSRRAGAAMSPEEEGLKGRLEGLHSQLAAPTQFNVSHTDSVNIIYKFNKYSFFSITIATPIL